MDQNQPMDVAREPVDLNDDAAFMDTGVLHEQRPCAKCGTNQAQRGKTLCKACEGAK